MIVLPGLVVAGGFGSYSCFVVSCVVLILLSLRLSDS